MALGEEVKGAAPFSSNALPTVGELVGVLRTDGRITVAQVELPLETTPPGSVRLKVGSGSWKEVKPPVLYSLDIVADVPDSAPASVGYFVLP